MTWAWVFSLGIWFLVIVYWTFGYKKVKQMMEEKKND